MKKHLFLLVTLCLFGVCRASAADRCSDAWTEADARAVMPGLESYYSYPWGHGSTMYDRVDTTGLRVDELMTPDTCYDDSCDRWRVQIYITIFPSTHKAVAFFETMKGLFLAEDRPPVLFENGESRLIGVHSWDYYKEVSGGDYTAPIEDAVESLKLIGRHGLAVILIDGWTGITSLPDVSAAIMTPVFSGYYNRATRVVDRKCGALVEKHPPSIKLTPHSDGYAYAFGWSILQGKGFRYTITDEDGIRDPAGKWKIDWKTFKVFRDANNITAQFVSTSVPLVKSAALKKDTVLDVLTVPDPKKFMKDHNVFDIRENGWHEIRFRICDTDGLCGSSPRYWIYFGPIIWMKYNGVEKGRILRFDLSMGNPGKETETWAFVGLYNAESGLWRFRYPKVDYYVWGKELNAWESSPGTFPAGIYEATKGGHMVLPDPKAPQGDIYKGAENLFFVFVLQDRSTGEVVFDQFTFPTKDITP